MSINRSVLTEALAAFSDPNRREEYFELYAPEVVLHGYPGVEPGLESVKRFYHEAMWTAFPDARVEPLQIIESGDLLTCRFVLGGTHLGPFLGVPATGRKITMPGITILRFSSGRCVERWSCSDFLAVLSQLGAFPA